MIETLFILIIVSSIILFVLYYLSVPYSSGGNKISFAGYLSFLMQILKKTIKTVTKNLQFSVISDRKDSSNNIIEGLQRSVDNLKNENEQLLLKIGDLEKDSSHKKNLLEDARQRIANLEQGIEEYKRLNSGVVVVNRNNVSYDVCDLIKSIYDAIKEARKDAIGLTLRLFDLQIDKANNCAQSLIEYIQNSEEFDTKEIANLYFGLAVLSGVFPPFAYDIENQKSDLEKRDYLFRQVFEDYVRPEIAELVFVLEKLRLGAMGTSLENKANNAINNLLEVCEAHSITVGYKATYEFLDEKDFLDFEIHPSNDTALQENQIGKIIRYSVNSLNFHILQEKSIIEAKL